ncbi:MAG: hypothetical protein JW819_10655 [Candidatus Krumholzibacteriota bacterium]|nr:hypothetical protein [Candidatus Krumholzibacteriota bacterium]
MNGPPLAMDAAATRLLHHAGREDAPGAVLWRSDANGTVPLHYHADTARVSLSALALARELALAPRPESCAGFLHSGVYYDGAAWHPDLRVAPPGATLRVAGGRVAVEPGDTLAPWRSGGPGDAAGLVAALQEAVAPLRGLRVLCDLTGGFDARLVALSLRAAGIPFAAAVTGAAESPDVRIARRLAEQLGVELFHEDDAPPEDLAAWREALRDSGGVLGVRQAARLLALQGRRAERYEVSAGGLGGELLRDFWWLQEPSGLDGPGDPDWGRLVRTRMVVRPFPPGILRGEWARALDAAADRRARWFAAETRGLDLPRKRDRLDHAYLRLHLPRWAGAAFATSLRRIRLHHPILHPAVLGVAFAAPTGRRRLARLTREAITRLDRRAAALPIESGGNALPLTPGAPWRYLPAAAALARGVGRRLPGGRRTATLPAWGDRPLDLAALERRGIVDASAVAAVRSRPGSLAPLERLQTLALLFEEIEGS